MSAKVATQKFSFPFSCTVLRSQQDELKQMGCIQVKTLTLQDLQEKPIVSKTGGVAVKGDNQEGPKLPPGAAAGQVLVCADSSQSAGLSRHSVFEKLTVDGEDQRPAAKRQLSSESAARTITVVKKSAVRTDAEEQRHLKPRTHLGERLCAVLAAKRRRRKDLFANSEAFHRVDSHVIRTGAEVTTHTAHPSHSLLLVKNWHSSSRIQFRSTKTKHWKAL